MDLRVIQVAIPDRDRAIVIESGPIALLDRAPKITDGSEFLSRNIVHEGLNLRAIRPGGVLH